MFYIAVYMRQYYTIRLVFVIFMVFFLLFVARAQQASSGPSLIDDATHLVSRDFTNKDGFEERQYARNTSAKEDCVFIRMIIGRDLGYTAEEISDYIDSEMFIGESEALVRFSHRYIEGSAVGFYIYKYGQRQNNTAYTQVELRDKAKYYARLTRD